MVLLDDSRTRSPTGRGQGVTSGHDATPGHSALPRSPTQKRGTPATGPPRRGRATAASHCSHAVVCTDSQDQPPDVSMQVGIQKCLPNRFFEPYDFSSVCCSWTGSLTRSSGVHADLILFTFFHHETLVHGNYFSWVRGGARARRSSPRTPALGQNPYS